jgi:hypothetical protein
MRSINSSMQKVAITITGVVALMLIGIYSGNSRTALGADQSPTTSPTSKPGIIRIKAGQDTPFTDSKGNVWMAEKGFDGGETIDRDPNLAIANTDDPGLYRNEHYSMDTFTWPLANGKYTVKLYFAETYDDEPAAVGTRVFSMNVQGTDFKDFDVFKLAGGAHKAYVLTVPVEVTNGKFVIKFTPNIQNPEINGIEIDPAS